MFRIIRQLCQTLSTRAPRIQDITAHLGRTIPNLPADGPLAIRPRDPEFSMAQIIINPDNDLPTHIVLTLAEPGAVSVVQLCAEFGPFTHAIRADWNQPARLIYTVDTPGQPYVTSIIAVVEADANGQLERGTVNAITLRRDIRRD